MRMNCSLRVHSPLATNSAHRGCRSVQDRSPELPLVGTAAIRIAIFVAPGFVAEGDEGGATGTRGIRAADNALWPVLEGACIGTGTGTGTSTGTGDEGAPP